MVEKNNKLMSPSQLLLTFLSNVDSNVKFVEGVNPFTIEMDGQLLYVYIKNLSPAQLSNNNPNIWRIQLPLKEEFTRIKESGSLFILLGYDVQNEVFTTWNPYWCKQRLNIGKSVSLYSRLSLQEKAHNTGEIERLNLNNDGDVVCIPKHRIGEYIKNIRNYYPEETKFIAKGSSIQKRLHESCNAEETFEAFKSNINDSEVFLKFMREKGVSERVSKLYLRHMEDLINSGYIDKYKDLFLARKSIVYYGEAIRDFLHTEDVSALDKIKHGYYRDSIKYYLSYLISIENDTCKQASFEEEKDIVADPEQVEYQVDEYGKLTKLDYDIRSRLIVFVKGEEYPDYDEMINIVCKYYPKEITETMSYADWIKLFENEDWKKSKEEVLNQSEEKRRSARTRVQTLRVTRPDGSVVQHNHVADTYIEIIQESFPDLITELNIKHAGVNIVSKEYDSKYRNYQREISDGFLVMTNSSTKTKYEDLCLINQELDLGLKIELIDINDKAILTTQGQ